MSYHSFARSLLVCVALYTARAERHVSVGRAYICGIDTRDLSAFCLSGSGNLTVAGPFHGVTAGSEFACGLRTHGSALCWSLSSLPISIPAYLAPAAGGSTAFLDLGTASRIAPATRYIVTLDRDTRMPPGRLRELVGVAGLAIEYIHTCERCSCRREAT